MKQLFFHSQLRRWALSLMLVLCCGPASAGDYYCDFTVGGLYYLYIAGTDDEVAVSYNNYETGRYGGNYTNYSGYISVPSTVTYEGKVYRVTAVSDHCFQDCSVTTVILPSTVKSIGTSAFLDCYQLTYVTLPQSLTKIGTSAFSGCTALQSVTLPKGLIEIGTNAFANCNAMTAITIPDGVVSIGASAFQGCSNLTSVSIPESIVSVGANAFYGTPWYDNLPAGVVYFGKIAYSYKGTMTENTSVVIKDGTTRIADTAFRGFSFLTSITIPNSVESIGASAFSGCSGLTTLEIPGSVQTIGASAFYGCTGLTSLSLGEGVESIGNYAFQNCSSLAALTIPNSVVKIGSYAFYYCSGLNSVQIGDGVTTIGDCTFQSCTNLNSVCFGTNVKSIGNDAFSGCENLSDINLPDGVEAIGMNAFTGTAWFEAQPEGLVYAGKVAYRYKGIMPNETEIVLEDGTRAIATSAFNGCSGLVAVTIPESVSCIGLNAFSSCTNLIKVTALMREPVAIDPYVFISITYATLYVPYECKTAYEASDGWKDFKEIVELDPVATDVSDWPDAIYPESATGLKGHDATLTIAMKNAQATSGYSFDLVLPEGVTVESYELSSRHNGHSATMNRNETTGTYSFAVLSLQSKELTGSDGAVLTLRLKVADTVAEGDYAVKIQNAKYSLTSGSTSVAMPETIGLLTIEDYVKGDANGDTTVDIADAVCIVNYVVGKATPAFTAAAADANGDGTVDIADAVRIVNLVVGKIDALSRQLKTIAKEPQ